MMNPLLLRRRMMLQRKKSDWVPMSLTMDETTRKCVPAWTDDELIELYGDAFKTFDIAPDTLRIGNAVYSKTSVLCYDRNTESTILGGETPFYLRTYEDNVCTATITRATTHKWQSQTSAKHIVCYGSSFIGRQVTGCRWLLLAGVTTDTLAQGNFPRQIHWYKNAEEIGLSSWNPNSYTMCQARGTRANSVLFMPPHLTGRFGNYKIGMNVVDLNYAIYCLPTVGLANQTYNLFRLPAVFKHVYLPQGLGKVRSVAAWIGATWNSSVPTAEKYFTLHVPDTGTEEGNAALIQECRDKGWTVAKGCKYIVCDYEQTLPIFKY